MTRPPAMFEDEQLDAALLSVLGEPAAGTSGAHGIAASVPRGLARSLAGSRRASATLGLAVVGAIAGLAFLTLGRDDAPDPSRVETAPPSQRAAVPSVDGALASVASAPAAAPAAAAPEAAPPAAAPLAARQRSIAQPTARPAAVGRVARAPDRSAGADEATGQPAVMLTDQLVTAAQPTAIAISAPAVPLPEPTTSGMVDAVAAPAETAVTVPTRRARRDSVVAIRSFRRQW